MLFSLALVFLLGLLLGRLFILLRLPALLGMLLTGILLGPQVLGLMDDSLLSISADLRRVALVIILTRAGMGLEGAALRRVGRPAALMCFLPACFEIAGMLLLAPRLLGLTLLESAILGSVVAAVSPAVVVPRMLRLIEEGKGVDKGVPQLVMAGASMDDVFVIVLFTTFTSFATGAAVSLLRVALVPVAIALGLAAGLALGCGLAVVFRRFHMRDTAKVLVLLSAAFLLVALEDRAGSLPFSGLVAVMAAGFALRGRRPDLAARLAAKFSKLWVAAEVLLFVLVGASVELDYAVKAGPRAVLLLLAVLVFRMAGVFACTVATRLNWRERLFCALAYLPKATVQAAIGGVPLAMGLACGQIVLTVAVLAILLTAPLGAVAIDCTWRKLLR